MQAVIFDMDGILIDSEQLVVKCWKEIGEKNGIEGIEQVAYECIGTNQTKSEEIFKKHYGEEFWFQTYRKEVSENYTKHINEGGVPMKPGVFGLLEYLKLSGVKIGLASSTRRARVEEQLEMAGIMDYFDAIVCGDMVSKSKPEPDIFLECCRQLGSNASETYVIEDSYNGIRAASRAGMKPIMVPDLLEPTEEMIQLSKEILHDLNEVKLYFEIQQ